jgi:UDP-glucose 4-epimerase
MSWSSRRVLVTGGAGFIGSNLVDRLVEEGARVRVLDNLKEGREENLKGVLSRIEFVRGDSRDRAVVERAVEGQEVVFHLAANASVPESVDDPAYDFETNVVGTHNVLRSVLPGKGARIVFSSSAAVYGPPQYTPVDETHPLEPISPYGGSKLAAERLLISYARTFDLEVAVARIFNTFGPRQPRYVAYDLLMKLKRNPRHLEVLGDGRQRRDYCYISDMVEALMFLGMAPLEEPLVVNISGGQTISIRELVEKILSRLGLADSDVVYGLPSWKGDIEVLSGDISRLRDMGFRHRISLEDGLDHMIRWFQDVHGRIV